MGNYGRLVRLVAPPIVALSTLIGCGPDSITTIPREDEVTVYREPSIKAWLVDTGSFISSREVIGVGTTLLIFTNTEFSKGTVVAEAFDDYLLDIKSGTYTIKSNPNKSFTMTVHYQRAAVGWAISEEIRSVTTINQTETYTIKRSGYNLIVNGKIFVQ